MPTAGLIVENKQGERMLYSVVFTDMQAQPLRLSLFDDRIVRVWETSAETQQELSAALANELQQRELTLILADRIEVDDATLAWFARLRE